MAYKYFLLFLMVLPMGCKKYLSEKSRQSYVVASSLKDLQGLLDRYTLMNYNLPYSGEVSADDYYVSDASLSTLTYEEERNMYLWQKHNIYTLEANDWSRVYNCVYITNTVLETLPSIGRDAANAAEWDNVRGQAFFFRALYYHAAALVWCRAYDETTASTDPGLPLRLNTNFNEASHRDNVRNTYALIVSDLQQASTLLPLQSVHSIRPSRVAAFALLARVYLSMGKFGDAMAYADSSLKYNNTLMDYNTDITATASYPFASFNKEVIWHGLMYYPTVLSPTYAKIDSILYASYDNGDIRQTAFFKKDNNASSVSFKGGYDPGNIFMGIANDEVYLTHAECAVRLGLQAAALADLNTLLRNRYTTGSYTPVAIQDSAALLALILRERRKELLMRGIRWMDIKRLDVLGDNYTMKRIYQGTVYTLASGSTVLPLPEDIISLSGMEQNVR